MSTQPGQQTELNLFIERTVTGGVQQFAHIKPMLVTGDDPREMVAQIEIYLAALEDAGWRTRDISNKGGGGFPKPGGGNQRGVQQIPAFCPVADCKSVVRVFSFESRDGKGSVMGWHCTLDETHTNSQGIKKPQFGIGALHGQYVAQLQRIHDEQVAAGVKPRIEVPNWNPAQSQGSFPTSAPQSGPAGLPAQHPQPGAGRPAQGQGQESGLKAIIGQEVRCPDPACQQNATVRTGTKQDGSSWYGIMCNVYKNKDTDKSHRVFANTPDELLTLFRKYSHNSRGAGVPLPAEEVWGG